MVLVKCAPTHRTDLSLFFWRAFRARFWRHFRRSGCHQCEWDRRVLQPHRHGRRRTRRLGGPAQNRWQVGAVLITRLLGFPAARKSMSLPKTCAGAWGARRQQAWGGSTCAWSPASAPAWVGRREHAPCRRGKPGTRWPVRTAVSRARVVRCQARAPG